jgi:cytoskeleton protein RodZ
MTARDNDRDSRQAGIQADSSGIKDVGAWLKSARESRGESLNDISQVTRIGKHYLEALEDGFSEKLPSSAYTRGFIRLYAAHLGLSPDEALEILDRNRSSSTETYATGTNSGPKDRPVKIEKPASIKRNRMIAVLALLSCIAAALFLFSRSDKLAVPERHDQSSPKVTSPQGTIQNDSGGLPETKTPSEPITPKPGGRPEREGIILRLKAVRDGKLHITIDDAVTQEYDLVAGDIVEWKAEKEILMDLENSASVEGELNGAPLKPFGEQGQPAHMRINSEGARKE